MNENTKWKRTLIWILSFMIVIGGAGYWGWHYVKRGLSSRNPEAAKVKPVLAKTVKKIVADISDSLYHIQYNGLDVNIDSGYAVITGLKMIPDSSIYHKMIVEKKAPDNIVAITSDKIVLSGVRLLKNEDGNTLSVGKMQMNHPVLHLTNQLKPYNNSNKEENKSFLLSMAKVLFKDLNIGNINSMQVDHIVMNNMDFTLVNKNESRRKPLALHNLNLNLHNFSTAADKNREKKQNNMVISIDHHRLLTENKLYYVDINGLQLYPYNRKMVISSAAIIPTVSKANFYKVVKEANTRQSMKFSNMVMSGINIEEFLQKQQLHIANVTIGKAWAEIYTNYNWRLHTPPLRRNAYPHEQLQQLALDITVDRMDLKEGDIYYKIVAEKSKEEAVFSMLHTKGTYFNITNNTAAKHANPYTKVWLQTRVMGAGLFQANWTFNLNNKAAPYTVTATMGAMDGKVLNPLTEPLSLMQVKSADIEKMKLYMTANEYKANGNIDMYYKNMKVNLLKRNEEEDTLKKRRVVSMLANVMLPNDNPTKSGKFRKGPINIVRDPRESFFGFLWRGMLDGMTSAMTGFNQKKEEPKNIVTELAKNIAGPERGQEHKSTGNDKERVAGKKKE